MSHSIFWWATASADEPQYLLMSHSIFWWVTASSDEPQHFPMSHSIFFWYTTYSEEPQHLSMSHNIFWWTATSSDESQHLLMSHSIFWWATTSSDEPPHFNFSTIIQRIPSFLFQFFFIYILYDKTYPLLEPDPHRILLSWWQTAKPLTPQPLVPIPDNPSETPSLPPRHPLPPLNPSALQGHPWDLIKNSVSIAPLPPLPVVPCWVNWWRQNSEFFPTLPTRAAAHRMSKTPRGARSSTNLQNASL